MRTFTKKTTNVGGSTGVIIPTEVLYAEGIKRGDTVRIIIEPSMTADEGKNPLLQFLSGEPAEA